MKEFIAGVHFEKQEKHYGNLIYLKYLKNQFQSKAFTIGLLSGCVGVGWFIKVTNRKLYYNNFAKFVYALNLFACIHTFVYEIWSKCYTDKEKNAYIDSLILKI